MPNGSIRVQSSTEYIIEVNDRGDTISFDTADTGLTSRLFSMFEEVDRLTADYTKKAEEIDARTEDTTLHTLRAPEGEGEDRVALTQNQLDGANLIDAFYVEARAAVDCFMGAGACQKIFGSKNYFTMFEDLTEQLKPHFDKMGVNMDAAKRNAAKKHAPNRAARRALK